MPKINTLVLALAPQEIREFLPEPLIGRLLAMAETVHIVDPSIEMDATFPARLGFIQPDVLVACWRTPFLPYPPVASLRYVCYLAGSVRKLVSRAHLEDGLTVTNWSGSISRVVAEGTLSLVLNCLRNAGYWVPAMHRDGAWKNGCTQTRSLFQRKVGIHGFGRVVRELTALLQPFDVELSIFAPETDPALYATHRARRVESLEELFRENDVVIELSPLIPATKGMITESLLRLLQPGAVFVNTGRGELVDQRALERVAREKKIQIGLDVYDVEPLPADSPLRGLPNVVLFPHLAGPTNDRRRDAGEFGLQNLEAYAADRPLAGVITPEVFDTHSM